MKKGLFAILAVLTVFALVTTGCDTGGGEKKWTVTFKLNYTGAGADIKRSVANGAKLATANVPVVTRANYTFDDWYDAATGGTAVDPTADPVTADVEYFAYWVPAITVTYNANTGVGGTKEDTATSTTYTVLGMGDVGFSKAGAVLLNWNTAANGSGTTYTIGQSITLAGPLTLYAIWKTPTEIPAANEIEETLTLGNGWFAVYKFTLPATKTFADYKAGGIVAQYKLDQDTIDTGIARAIRVMGNFTNDEVNGTVYKYAATQATGADGAALAAAGPLVDLYNGVQMATVAQWQNGASAPYIITHMGGGYSTVIGDALSELGASPEAGEWFPLSYSIDGSQKNAGHDSAKRLPADTDTGPFYFAIGLPGQDSGNTFGIKNVVLMSTTGAADVVATPLYYKDSDITSPSGTEDLYRAYSGQFTKDGGNGTSLANWKIEKGATAIRTAAVAKSLGGAKTVVTVTFNQNYTGAPADKTLKVVSGETLAASQLSKPERSGYLCTGWFNDATNPAPANVILTTTTFSADTTIYAQWKTFVANPTPWEIANPTMSLHGGADGATLEDGFIPMMSEDKNETAGRYKADSLICFSLDADDIAALSDAPTDGIDGFLKVKIEWEAKRSVTTGGTMALILKNGLGEFVDIPAGLRPDGLNRYPDLGGAEDLTASGSFEYPLSMYGSPPAGKKMAIGFQINKGGHSDEFLLKITKITFFN